MKVRSCSKCGAIAIKHKQYCRNCGTRLPPVIEQQGPRKCRCGAIAERWKKLCVVCGERIAPSAAGNRHAPAPTTVERIGANDRMLDGMRAPPCICGLRGPHECTRTEEWKAETLAYLRAKLA